MIGKLKRTLAMALALCMVFSLCPVSAMAEELAPEVPVCEHSYVAGASTATCTADGVVSYTCSACGDSYEDVAAATGHSYAESERTEATCTADGSVTMSCSVCGDTYTEALPAGHSWSEWTEADGLKSRSCTVCGESESEALPVVKQELSGEYTPLYFYNEEGWAEVYAAWLFDEEDFDDLALPGVAMSATALEGVWAVSVPVEADAIIFGNGITGAGERRLESRIPAEGDLYAQGEWQYSYAFTAPLAGTGSFSVSAKGSGTVSIDGNAVTGSVELAEGTHNITVAPAFGEGYYVKSLSIGGTPVELDDQSFENGACTVSYTLAADETATIAVEFALYRPVAGKTGLYTISVNGYSKNTRWVDLDSKILTAVFGNNAASSGYTMKMLARNSIIDSTTSYQSFSSLKSMESSLLVALDTNTTESFSIAFSGNDRYPGFETIENIKIYVKESRPKPVITCTDEDKIIEMLEEDAPSGGSYWYDPWEDWAKGYLSVVYGSGTSITNYSVDVDSPNPYPEVGQSGACVLNVSVSGTEEYADAKATITLSIVNGFLANIIVTEPTGASIKIYTDSGCTTELSARTEVTPSTYYVKMTANEGYKVTGLTGVTGASGDESAYKGTLTVTAGATEANTYRIGGSAAAKEYTIKFDTDGGAAIEPIKVAYGTAIAKPADPEKTGYTFTGWSPALPATMPAGDLTVKAQWKINSYTVTWNVDGNETEATYEYGDAIVKPADPEKTGYTFTDWQGYTDGMTMGDTSLEFVAQWKVNSYTVTWNVDGNETEVTYEYGTAIAKPADPSKNEFTFAGWRNETDNNNTVPVTMPAKDLKFTAIWTADNVVIWNVDGTKSTETYKTGATIEKPADPEKTGYTFDGWQGYTDGMTMGDTSLEFVAQWKINSYTVTFDTEGGSAVAPITADYGAAITAPAAPTKEGYTFAGWDAKIPATMPAKNMTITAKWTVNQYTVTFDTEGGSAVAPITADYGAAITAPADPTKEDHAFTGWVDMEGNPAEVPANMPLNGMSLKATWVPDKNGNGVDDGEETAAVTVTVTGPGKVTLSDNYPNTLITNNGDGSYTVLFDSRSAGANVITVTATPKDMNGNDGSVDYIDSLSHETLAVENGVTYDVTAAFATRSIAAFNGEIFINRFNAANALTDAAAAEAITSALRGDILEAAGLDANEPYIVTVMISYQGYDVSVVVGKNGVEGDLPIPDLDPDQAAAYALSKLDGMGVKISLAAEGKLPAVEKIIDITVREARPAATISLDETVIEMDFDKADQVEAAARANVSVTYGSGTTTDAWTLTADKTAEELMTGELQTITYKVTVAETANYTGAEASFTVKATHKTYEPVISLTEATDDGDAAYSISGSTVTVTAVPDEGCYVESVVCTLDGETVAVTGGYAADRSYTAAFETQLGNDSAKEYDIVVSYGRRSIAKNSSIPSLTYNEDEATLLKAVYAAIVDEANSEGGIAYGKVKVTANKTVTGAGTYEFTVTWADDSVANKYPTVTAKAEIVLTNELILSPVEQQSLTAPVVDGEIALTEQDILAAVDAGNVPDTAGLEKTLIAPSVDEINAALTKQGDSVEVTVKISVGGEGTPYDPAEAEVTLTISAPVNQAKISVEAYENGSLKINGTETAAGTDSYAPGDYTLSLKGNGEYVPNTIVISLDGSELQSLVGEASAEFSVIDGSGKAHDYVPEYIVSVSFAVPAVEIPETATMNYYVGMENDAQQLEQLAMEALENGEGGVVYTPADLEEGSSKLSYRAREAKTYIYTATIDPRDYGIGFIPAQTVEVPVEAGELWLDLGESFTPAVEPTQEQIKAIVDRVIDTYGINALMSMYENDRDQLIAILKAEIMKDPVFVNYYNYYGAHRFGDDVTNTELVKLSVDSDKYGVLESNTSLLTLDDTRIETEISASTGVELVYGFSAEDLIEALGASVTAKDGADLGVPQIETDVEAMCASDELQTVKLFYPGNSEYRRCSAEVQILVKRAGVDVFVDNRLIRWEEGLSYELPVGTDPAGVDTITFIAGLNVANADIDAGAIGSGNPVVGLRGDIILLIPDALSGALAYVGIPTEGYMSLGDVKDALLKLADISGLTNSTNESISQLITMLESISGDKLDAGVYIGSELPTDIGVYVVGAVSADANYETDFGAGYIIIAPNGVKAKLSWNMTDDNHAFTLDKLESFDFGASAEVIESTLDGANMPGSAQHHLEYLFVGVDDEGELLIDRCTDPNSVELGMGVYSQVAYIANWGNAMYYAEPIARPIIVTPNVADVAILDSNGNENYAQLLTYDGSAKAVTVTVDGKTVTEGLTVRYIGSDLSADGWYRENAPTDAGAYTVVAIYTEKDADGKLVKAGAAVAGLVIKPAAADIELNDAEYTYDGNEYFAEIGNGGFDYITAAVDRANNTVYVNLPDDIGAHLSRLSGMLPEAAQTKLDAFLAKYESFDGDVQTATVNAELVGILNTIINADTSAAAEAKARELAAAIIDKLAANEEIKAAYAKLKAELEALKAKVGEELPDEIEAKLIEYLKNVISVGEDGVDIDVAQIKASLYAKIAELESKLPASVVSQLRAMADELITVVEANLDREAIEAEIDKLVATLETLDSDDAKTVVKYVLGALYGYADESGLKSFISQAYAKLDAQTYIDYAKSMIDSIAGIYGGSIDTSGVEAAIEALAKDVKAKIESGSFDADDLDALETDVDAILSALVAVLNRAPDVKVVFGKNPVEAGEYECYIVNVSKNYAPELAKAVLVIKPAEVTVTMDSHDLALNDAIPEFSYTIEGLVGDDKLTVTPSCDIVDTSVVGSYTVSASVSENPNYVITVVDGTITVSDKRSQVTITAKEDAEVEISDSLTYDDVIAALEIAVSDAAGNEINDYELVIKDAEGNIVEPADLVAGESYTAVVTFKGNTTQAPAEKEISFTAVDSREGLYAIDLSGNTVGVGEGSVVEIDGVKYTVEEDSIVWVSETTHKIVVSYNWASSDSTVEPNYDGGTGPHYEYPCNMYVWYLSFENDSYTAERIEDLDDFLSYKGTSIRMTGKQGIRIFTAVNEADRAKLINGSLISHEALAGYKLVEYGTLFAMAEKYGDLTVENGLRSYAYSTAQGRDAVFSRSGGDIWYTGMLVDLDVELCDDELLIRPYMIIEGPDGEQLTIYGGTLQRTIGYVALQNRDYKPTQAAHDFIWNIIYAVYGEDFEYNY